LEQFRDWLLVQLDGSEEGVARCAYSGVPVTALDLRVDHAIPISRGGSLGLENLCVTTDSANREKGGLTGEEYRNLLSNLEGLLQQGLLHPDGYKDIRKRLRGQTAIFHKKKPSAIPVYGDPELLKDSEQPF
jgi:hypothetical protein